MVRRSTLDQAIAAITGSLENNRGLEQALGVNQALERAIKKAMLPLSLGSTLAAVRQIESAHRSTSRVLDSLTTGSLGSQLTAIDKALEAIKQPLGIAQLFDDSPQRSIIDGLLPRVVRTSSAVQILGARLERLGDLYRSPTPVDVGAEDPGAGDDAHEQLEAIVANVTQADGFESKLDAITQAIRDLGTSTTDRLVALFLAPLLVSIMTMLINVEYQKLTEDTQTSSHRAQELIRSLAGPELAYVDLHTVVHVNTRVRDGFTRTSQVIATLPRGSVVSSAIKVGRLRHITWRSADSGRLLQGWIRAKAVKPLR